MSATSTISDDAARCVLCAGDLEPRGAPLFDTRLGVRGSYRVAYCADCGLGHTLPRPSAELLGPLYESHYNFGGENGTVYARLRQRFYDGRLYRLWLALDGDIAFHARRGTGRLLDVGCNEGRGVRLYRRHGFDAEGLEPNARAASVASRAGLTVHTQRLEEFDPSEAYDVVVLANVLEHALDPLDMLRHARRVLKPGGEVWISCPNHESWMRALFGRYWVNWHVPFHIVHFDADRLGRMVREAGLALVSVRSATPALWVAQSTLAALFSKEGRPTREMRRAAPLAALMAAIRLLLSPFLWLGNRLGRGDCLVAIARRIE